MKRSISTSVTYVAALVLSFLTMASPGFARSIKLNAEFEGTIPGSDVYGDAFGYTLSVFKNNFIVGAPYAAPDGQQFSGAVYFYHKNHLGKWYQSQVPFVIPFALDYTSYARIVTRGDWLFVPVVGTPVDTSVGGDKDYSGSIYIFKRSKNHQYNQVQVLTNPAGPVVGRESGFGSYLDTDGEKWLVVGGYNTNTAYFYKLNKNSDTWALFQTVTIPAELSAGDLFVAINNEGKHAFLGYPNLGEPTNGIVFAYKYQDNSWQLIQTLQGISPISTLYNTGDSFGEFISIHHHWAVIGAPTDNTINDLAGAAYFLQYNEKKGQWFQKQKVYSDLPSVFFGYGVGIIHDIIIVSDPGRSFILPDDTRHIFQGAAAVWRKQPVCWEEQDRAWFHVETLFDPNGRAYDFLGMTGIDIHDEHVALGTNTSGDQALPNGYPGKRNPADFDPPVNNGRALLYKIRHCCR